MAVDGRKLRETLRLGSEDWIEFPCSPCVKDGKNVASIKHCIECGKNLCKSCLSYHEKFTSGHQLVDKLSDAKTGQKRPDLPVQRCGKHGGKLVDVYCPIHDVVGCSTCVAVDHSSCKGKQFIPDVVKTSLIAKEVSKLETRMTQLMTRLDKIKHDKQNRIKSLQQEKDNILKEIRDLRKKIKAHLDWMEKTLVNEVESWVAGKMRSAMQCVKTVDTMTSSVAKIRKTLQEARNINDAEMFVQIKQGSDNMRENESKLEKLSSECELGSVKLFPSRVKDVLFGEKDNIFGRISEVINQKSIEHFGDFSVRLQSDKNRCEVGDFCLTTSGSIICTDNANNQLKKLDSYYAVIEHLILPSFPHSLCEVDSTQLAVTLMYDKKVQFVSQQPLKLGRWFTVGDCCGGLACNDGHLYVCCGEYENEGPGHIEVYDIDGCLLITFYEGLSFPFYIKSASNSEFILADQQSRGNIRLLKLNTRQFSLSEIHVGNGLTGIGRFCRIGDGQLCITRYESNNIVLLSEDGKKQQTLLTVQNGIMKPWNVLFNEKQSQLIVALANSDIIKVFHAIT